MKENTGFSFKLAKVIRIITAPPFMAAALLIYMLVAMEEVYSGTLSIWCAFLGLTILPLLAYPVHRIVPSLYAGGRDSQRKLAFVFTGIAYMLLAIYAGFSNQSFEYRLVAFTHFFTVIVLLILNKGLKIKASGHGASSGGVLALFVVFAGWKAIIPSIIIIGLMTWASVKTKRHTIPQLLAGFITVLACLGVAYLIC